MRSENERAPDTMRVAGGRKEKKMKSAPRVLRGGRMFGGHARQRKERVESRWEVEKTEEEG